MKKPLSLSDLPLAELKRIAKNEFGLTPEDVDATGNSPHRKKTWIEAIIRERAAQREHPKPTGKSLPVLKLIQTYPRTQKLG